MDNTNNQENTTSSNQNSPVTVEESKIQIVDEDFTSQNHQ